MRKLFYLICITASLGLVSACGVKGDPLPRVALVQ